MDCSLSESFYSLNDDIAAEQAANSPEGGLGVLGAGGDITALTTSYLPSYPSTPPNQVNYFKRHDNINFTFGNLHREVEFNHARKATEAEDR